jgi:hypothetical protein
MDGTLVVDQGSIADVLAVIVRLENWRSLHITPRGWALPQPGRYLFRRVQQFNPLLAVAAQCRPPLRSGGAVL